MIGNVKAQLTPAATSLRDDRCAMMITDQYFGRLSRIDSDAFEAWIDAQWEGVARRLKVVVLSESVDQLAAALPVIRTAFEAHLQPAVKRIRSCLANGTTQTNVGDLIRLDIHSDDPTTDAAFYFTAQDLAAPVPRRHDDNCICVDSDFNKHTASEYVSWSW